MLPYYPYLVSMRLYIYIRKFQGKYHDGNIEVNTYSIIEGCVIRYHTDHAKGVEDDLPYARHDQENGVKDPQWLHQ